MPKYAIRKNPVRTKVTANMVTADEKIVSCQFYVLPAPTATNFDRAVLKAFYLLFPDCTLLRKSVSAVRVRRHLGMTEEAFNEYCVIIALDDIVTDDTTDDDDTAADPDTL